MAYDPAVDGLGFLPTLSAPDLRHRAPKPSRQTTTWRFPIVVPDLLASLTFYPILPAKAFKLARVAPYQTRSVTSPATSADPLRSIGWLIQRPDRLQLRTLTVLQRGQGVIPPPGQQVVVAQSLAWTPQGRPRSIRALRTGQPPIPFVRPLTYIATGRCIELLDLNGTTTALQTETVTTSTLINDAVTPTTLVTETIC